MMKKLLSFILLTLLLILNVSAEEIDFSKYSNDELLRIQSELTSVLAERGLTEAKIIGSGKYVGGETIPAGTYKLTCVMIPYEMYDRAFGKIEVDRIDGEDDIYTKRASYIKNGAVGDRPKNCVNLQSSVE